MTTKRNRIIAIAAGLITVTAIVFAFAAEYFELPWKWLRPPEAAQATIADLRAGSNPQFVQDYLAAKPSALAEFKRLHELAADAGPVPTVAAPVETGYGYRPEVQPEMTIARMTPAEQQHHAEIFEPAQDPAAYEIHHGRPLEADETALEGKVRGWMHAGQRR